jgi:hypothetical protein
MLADSKFMEMVFLWLLCMHVSWLLAQGPRQPSFLTSERGYRRQRANPNVYAYLWHFIYNSSTSIHPF